MGDVLGRRVKTVACRVDKAWPELVDGRLAC